MRRLEGPAGFGNSYCKTHEWTTLGAESSAIGSGLYLAPAVCSQRSRGCRYTAVFWSWSEEGEELGLKGYGCYQRVLSAHIAQMWWKHLVTIDKARDEVVRAEGGVVWTLTSSCSRRPERLGTMFTAGPSALRDMSARSPPNFTPSQRSL